MRLLPLVAFGCLVSLVGAVDGRAQAPAPSPSPGQSGYTLHVGTRIVLTDVTVTDKDGHPVRGLDRSSFTISDDGRPQRIASFTEHTRAESEIAPTAGQAGVFSNSYLQHPPAAFDLLLLDLTTIHFVDQMYLAQQLDKFLDGLPAGQPLAIYTRVGDYVVMLQDVTSDHDLLRAALHRAIPRLQQPGSWIASDSETLAHMCKLLERYPGRKNLIWFSGGSNAALMVEAGEVPATNMQPLYDALEAERIAVYPIDVRGLTMGYGLTKQAQNGMMLDTAHATGGEAFFQSNGLRQITARVVKDASDFYTLTYTPPEQNFDNRWHNVKVTVTNRSWHLSYRRGYFDDGNNVSTPAPGARKILTSNGDTVIARPEPSRQPIVFRAAVVPAGEPVAAASPGAPGAAGSSAPKKNEKTYQIRYTLPVNAFVPHDSSGGPQLMVGTGAFSVNQLGAPLARQVSTERVTLNEKDRAAHPDGFFTFDQRINLPKGENLVTVLVWDEASGRFGTVQVPVMVPKRGK